MTWLTTKVFCYECNTYMKATVDGSQITCQCESKELSLPKAYRDEAGLDELDFSETAGYNAET